MSFRTTLAAGVLILGLAATLACSFGAQAPAPEPAPAPTPTAQGG